MNFKERLISMLGKLGRFVAVLFKETLQRELVIVVPLARELVAQAAKDPSLLSSSAKRGAVLAELGTRLVSKQMAVGEDILRLGIELAYQDFKQETSVAVTTTTTTSTPSTPVV